MPLMIQQQHKAVLILLSSGLLSACAGLTTSEDANYDTQVISGMYLSLSDEGSRLNIGTEASAMPGNIAGNLRGLGYDVTNDPDEATSHQLTAVLGTVAKGSTPPGFSFSSGNSDPRALGFQKATVLPITCILAEKGKADEKSAELNMTFKANVYLPKNQTQEKQGELQSQLINDVSTVCYNLLSGLNTPKALHQQQAKTTGKGTTSSSGWLPTISYEVVEEDPLTGVQTAPAAVVAPVVVPVEVSSPATQAVPQATSKQQQAAPAQPQTTTTDTEKAAVPVSEPPAPAVESISEPAVAESAPEPVAAPAEPVSTQYKAPKSRHIKPDPRKKIIIRNHGNPITFTFGHERK